MLSRSRFLDIKAEHNGALLLFSIGDFYEAFFEDARFVAKTVGLTLTTRNKAGEASVEMTGFPHHSLEAHLQTLHDAGFDTALVEE